MRDAYVRVLEIAPGFSVTNRSIGSSPNVVLLDFLGRETDLNYDFIIIETAVVDFIQGHNMYPRDRARETLELFINHVRTTSRARVIILTIPTRYALLAPDASWQERLYNETAARFGIPILDGFRLIRQLIGGAKLKAVSAHLARAEQLVAAFDLPRKIAPSLAWRDLRDRQVQTNSLGLSAFVDHAHVSGPIHSLLGSILVDYIISAKPYEGDSPGHVTPQVRSPVITVDPNGGRQLVRTSTLMSRGLISLEQGETACYECPPGYRAFGLLVNKSKTVCFLQIVSPQGEIAFDMRFKSALSDWTGIVVPIIDPVGNGAVEVTVLNSSPESVTCRKLHNTEARLGPWYAELGELIVVREDWRDGIFRPVGENPTAFHLEDTTWAQWAIQEAAVRAGPVAQGIERDGCFVPAASAAFAATLLSNDTVTLSFADQARLLLVLGMTDRLAAFLDAVLSRESGEPGLEKMRDAMKAAHLGKGGTSASPADTRGHPNAALAAPCHDHTDFMDHEAPQEMRAIAHDTFEAANPASHEAEPATGAPSRPGVLAVEQSDVGDRDAMPAEAQDGFPDDIRLLHDLARAHEKQQNWPAAERLWRRYITRDDSRWWAYAALAATLRAQQRGTEAEVILRDGAARLPSEPEILAEAARAAEIGGDLPEAMRTWERIIALFPDRWIGFRGKAKVLGHSGRQRDADRLIETHAPLVSSDIDALHDLARLAERRRDWSLAENVWRSFLAANQRSPWAYAALAGALREQSRYPEAEDILRDALQRFPQDIDMPVEAARCAELRGALAEAARHWRAVSALRPRSPRGPLGEAAMLRRQGQIKAADEVILAAVDRLPDEPLLLEAYGRNAMAGNAWAEALTRLETAQYRFPSNDALRQRIFEVQLKVADEAGTAPPANFHDDGGADRALLMQFESLGGGGHGCEFGIFQRHFGAEPLGLLRWADIFQDALSQALETEFAGIGDPEFTNIFVPKDDANPEYWTTDTRYHMAMRSFVPEADVPLDRMRQQVTKRFQYLRRKLVEDLRSGAKILVYKNMKQNLTETELRRLHTACRHYGDNTLLYIRYEDARHPCGTVVAERDGLLIGYIDHFSHAPGSDEFLGSATDALLQLCKKAHALWGRDVSSSERLLEYHQVGV